MDATARPLDEATAAELARVNAELEAVSARHDEMAGWTSASAEIPARNGGALVVEALQEEDGGVSYRVDRRSVDADEDWSVARPPTRSPPRRAGCARSPNWPVNWPARRAGRRPWMQ
ncbi:hypothetical protein AB0B27_14330 [Micromonospora rifamycinica]|uniref:hypothetical protein n=1 Tax=Micromonospora rifamycinica TaxID=291594 RepID=UPI0033D778DE